MQPDQFERLAAAGYNRIPIHREVLADLDTPLSSYLKLADGPYSYLLESVQGGERWGRYSIIGLPCRLRVRVTGRQVTVEEDGRPPAVETVDDPLAWLEAFAAGYRVPELPGLPRFTGGLVGYFGYETVGYVEPRLAGAPGPDPLGNPDLLLMLSEEVVVFDNLGGKLAVIVLADPAQEGALARCERRIDRLVERLRGLTPHYARRGGASRIAEDDFVSGFSRPAFEAAVAHVRERIAAGDVMQVVLSQRLSIPFARAPLDLYRALRVLNPSPYLFYLHLDDFHVVGSSPEILVRLEDGEVTVRPIAGTRPRGRDEAHDRALADELLADEKERAEHVMLIDLGRNDVGRVAETGSVAVRERMAIERYSHVMHIVSTVSGRLRAGLSAFDALRAAFPAGTVSGAPKIRAMELVRELEPVKRGVYAGAVGYLGWHGNMDTAIAIRTAVIKADVLHVQVGAGIVHDSDPRREWEETMNKGRAIFRAVAMVEGGLDDLSG